MAIEYSTGLTGSDTITVSEAEKGILLQLSLCEAAVVAVAEHSGCTTPGSSCSINCLCVATGKLSTSMSSRPTYTVSSFGEDHMQLDGAATLLCFSEEVSPDPGAAATAIASDKAMRPEHENEPNPT